MSEKPVHVRIHRGRDGYWAEVVEWPGCFATGRTWDELTEAIEEAIGLYVTPEEQEELTQVALRIREIELELDADLPLLRARADASHMPLASLPRTRDPHPDWPLRGFQRRDGR